MKKNNELEMKLYEKLGVRTFQKLVFKLEKLIHFKDKGKNINYHIKGNSVDELKEFQKFLYFNGAIHVRNAVVLTGFLVIQQLFFSNWFLLYIVPSLIKNGYCVMLQRYNYLRVNKIIDLKKKSIYKKVEDKKETFQQENEEKIKNIKQNKNSLEQLNNLKRFIHGQEDVILDDSSIETLTLLREFIVENRSNDNHQQENINVKKLGGRKNGKI